MRAAAADKPSSGSFRYPGRWACIAVAALVVVLALRVPFASLSLVAASRVAVLVSAAAVGVVMVSAPRRFWSLSAIYLVTLAVFHLGLLLLIALSRPVPLLGQRDASWLYRGQEGRVPFLAMTGVLCCAIGILLAGLIASRQRRQLGEAAPIEGGPAARLAGTGLAVLAVSLVGWIVTVVQAGGAGLLTSSYGAFLAATQDGVLPYVNFGIGLGLALLAATPPSASRRLGFSLFLGFAFVALPLGLRGEVMFPALAALAIAARRRPLLAGRYAAVAAIALLALIGALREVREVGIGNISGTSVAASPVDGLAELGFSIRPLSEAVFWHDDLGEAHTGGATYLAPFDRAIRGKVLAQPILPGNADPRLFNVLISGRVGPIGGSPMAEAYHNGGLAGVGLVMLTIGFVLGRLDVWPATVTRLAVSAVLFVPLLIQVRNAFTPVPLQVLLGLLVVAVVAAVPRGRPAPARPRARSPVRAAAS